MSLFRQPTHKSQISNADLEVVLVKKKDIIWLDVSVDNFLLMHKVNCEKELFHYCSDVVFDKSLAVVQHVYERTVFGVVHYQVNLVYFSVNCMQLYYVVANF